VQLPGRGTAPRNLQISAPSHFLFALLLKQVSIDPQRVYVSDPASTPHTCVPASEPGPNGEAWCWWQCTVKGGREARDIDAVAVGRRRRRPRGRGCRRRFCCI
jgi:hypothetical protein